MLMTMMMITTSILIGLVSIMYIVLWKQQSSSSSSSSVHIPSKSAVLITGISRGIGKHLAESLAARGYTVLGTVRSQSSYDEMILQNNNNNIHPILFDVTKDEHIPSAIQAVKDILERKNSPSSSSSSSSSLQPLRLIGIINNAGINPEAEQWKATTNNNNNKNDDKDNNNNDGSNHGSETSSSSPKGLSDLSMAKQVLDTNVLGTIRTTHAFVPLLQQQEEEKDTTTTTTIGPISSARIILIGSYFGSLAGAVGLPHVYYETSKHALEGLADGMRRGFYKEYKESIANTSNTIIPIDVSLIKPGNIVTDMNDYGEVGPELVTEAVLHALESSHPNHRYYPGTVKGLSSYLLCTIFDVLPTWISDKLL